jgi:hypothetical protein
VTSLDLKDEQFDVLFATIRAHLQYQHALLARLQTQNFPADDPLYLSCRESVLALRELYLIVNDG